VLHSIAGHRWSLLVSYFVVLEAKDEKEEKDVKKEVQEKFVSPCG
jgi:hypothetical protein